jgi:hypothetical protein
VSGQANNLDKVIPGSNNDIGTPLLGTGVNLGAGQQLPVGAAANNGAVPTTSTPATAADNIVRFDQSSGQLVLTAAQQKSSALTSFANNVNNYITNRAATLATAYVEDTNVDTNILKNPPLPLVAIFDPKPSLQNAQQNSDQTKTNPDPDAQTFSSGTGFVASIMGNIFSDKTKEFQTIELGIRGDPWWLAISNIKLNNLALQLTNNPGTANTTDFQANFLGGDNCFLLEMRVGVVIDETTGLARADSQGADFFTGIYAATEIVSNFREGKFTQNIKAIKDILSQNPISTQNEQPSAPSLSQIANPNNSQEIATQLAAAGI